MDIRMGHTLDAAKNIAHRSCMLKLLRSELSYKVKKEAASMIGRKG